MEELSPPPFTGSLDAKVPAENIVLSHHLEALDQWFTASLASDGRVFIGRAKTEPLARRAAGLRTFEHLNDRASGRVGDPHHEDISRAKLELASQLEQLRELVANYNDRLPFNVSRRTILLQLDSSREILDSQADRSVLAKWILPGLLFIAGAFVQGAIGVYAEQALDALTSYLKA